MWIKICANTNLNDAMLAAELGANAVGFVFAPSRRQVNASTVAAITPLLPSMVERVGVFPAMGAPEIAEIVRVAGLTGVQLHGGLNTPLLRELRTLLGARTQTRNIEIIQTVHWDVDGAAKAADDVRSQLDEIAREGLATRVLVDSKAGQATGGTGVAFDWAAARDVLGSVASKAPRLQVILAGGLRAENVGMAIRELAPWGVDVASGVESEPGRKSREQLAAFLSAARAHAH